MARTNRNSSYYLWLEGKKARYTKYPIYRLAMTAGRMWLALIILLILFIKDPSMRPLVGAIYGLYLATKTVFWLNRKFMLRHYLKEEGLKYKDLSEEDKKFLKKYTRWNWLNTPMV